MSNNLLLTPIELDKAIAAKGFMPTSEGKALAEAASKAPVNLGPMLEVGSYCGKSACFIAPIAARVETVLFCVDHHRGSEENQPGWQWHDPELVDADTNRIDTLPFFRKTVEAADIENAVVAVVGHSATVAQYWAAPLSFLFIDGGHGVEVCKTDYASWIPKIAPGGLLCIHDVFLNEKDGGLAPYEHIYKPAIDSGEFKETSQTGSLRVLQKG